ncbi:MAG: MBL fold metallo-hydrolase [Xenococcaceae cyanobacterium MO_207.B15]|nr:MBL fold metallo-hydrolase [Xenococcaceae cyanobacterium MO_207.B15]
MKRSYFDFFLTKTMLLIMSLVGTIMLSLSPPLNHLPIHSQPTVAQTEGEGENITIHNYYTSPPFEEIYYYAIETEEGLILIDTGRLLSQARYTLENLQQFNKSILAILITHPHTDHFGGLPVFVEAAGRNVPIYASQITFDSIKSDKHGYIENRNRQLGQDFPDSEEIPIPNSIVEDGQNLTIGGVSIIAYDFPINESDTTTTYYLPEQRVMFVGDLVNGEKTPGLFEGNTSNWLNTLKAIQQRFPDLHRVYPGHTQPDNPNILIPAQIDYIQTFRNLVSQALKNDEVVDEEEKRDISNEIERRYPDYETSLLLPGLIEININGVAEELKGESNNNYRSLTIDLVPANNS